MQTRLSILGALLTVQALAACEPTTIAPQQPEPVCFTCRPDGGRGGQGGGGEGGEGGGGAGGEGGGGAGGGTGVPLRLDAVAPRRGDVAGGTAVGLTGSGFLASVPAGIDADRVTEVLFGGNLAIGVRVIDDDTILVPAPPGVPGDADVTVRNPFASATCAGCFRYAAQSELLGVAPDEGPLAGGQRIVLSGRSLRAGMTVVIGARAALDVTLEPDGSLSALTPPGDAEGPVDLRLFDADGQVVARKAYTFRADLSVRAVNPPGGPLGGGNEVLIEGGGLAPGVTVTFGGIAAPALLTEDGKLRAAVPPSAAPGAVDVAISLNGVRAVLPAAYGYYDPDATGVALHAVSPARGPIGGGTPVVLVGSGLDAGGLVVRFGGALATATPRDAHFADVLAPVAAGAGPVDVTVRTLAGGATLPQSFRYTVPTILREVTPARGPEAGGTAITLQGEGFPLGAKLFIGALEATQVVRVDATTITAVTPRGTAGPVPVRLVDPADPDGGALLSAGFSYEGAFGLTLVAPDHAARAGGERVQLFGRGFGPGLAVRFGEAEVAQLEVTSPFSATLVVPRGEVGTVDVTATLDDQASSLPASFSYFDPTNALGGASGGPIAGTLNVTCLDGGQARQGVPLEGCVVVVGESEALGIAGRTDDRGQLSLSDPRLVKAQIVTVALEAYQTVTVVNQASENLTVYMIPNFEPAQCDNGLDDDGDGLVDFDGDGDPGRADIDGCQCAPQNSPRPELCQCPMMPMEFAGCCNGEDDDGDGLIDSDDPDCACTGGSAEGPLPQCGNCGDDDGDGSWDYQNMMGPPDPGCASPQDDDERGAIVTGRVFGFKRPLGVALQPGEREVAYVSVSVRSVYAAPPFAGPRPKIAILSDGGTFSFEFASDQLMALYAVYGVEDERTGRFTPYLMGVKRGVNATTERELVGQDIVLDMHLALDVPLTVDNPPTYGGAPGVSTVYGYLDLAEEGVIPVGEAVVQGTTGEMTGLPVLSGESFLFQLWGNLGGQTVIPLTVTFRRQTGDLSQTGVTLGPLLGLTRMLEPAPTFTGIIEWTNESGPDALLAMVQIDEPTMAGPVPQWQIVVPGSETRVVVPPSVVQMLNDKYDPGTQLQLTLITGREPRFDFDQWNYQNLGLDAFTSFTYDIVPLVLE